MPLKVSPLKARNYPKLWILLALIVVIAQLGAQAHAYTHLSSRADTPVLAASGHSATCADCLAFAPLLSTASGSAFPVVHAIAPPETIGPSQTQSSPEVLRLYAYRSRAPPLTP